MTSRSSSNRTEQAARRLKALRNILEMEAKDGFQDRSVTGGLEGFLSSASQDAGTHPVLRALADHGMLSVAYGSLDVAKRERWVRETQRMLEAQLPPPASAFASDRGGKQGTNASGRARQVSHPLPNHALSSERGNESTPPSPEKPRAAKGGGYEAPGNERAGARLTFDSPVSAVRGVNRQNAGKLAKLGLHTVRDLIFHFPNRHVDYSARRTISRLRVGEEQTVVVSLWEASQVYLSPRIKRASTVAAVGDETGNMRVIWFNQPWVAVNLQKAMERAGRGRVQLALSGKVTAFNGRRQMESPEWELLDDAEGQEMVHTGRLVPVYPKTEGLYDKTLRNIVRRALEVVDGKTDNQEASKLDDQLPNDRSQELGFMPLQEAVLQMHYPDSFERREQARRRLAFDELLTLQVAMARRRQPAEPVAPGIRLRPMPQVAHSFLDALPFQLTDGQRHALDEAMADVELGDKAMSRLLQGDVGSGKTVVAMTLLLTAVGNGYQGALMAPTEVLAEQHFINIRRLLSGFPQPSGDGNWFSVYLEGHSAPVSIGLLTGSTRATARRELNARAADGSLDILIGTHALIQKEVDVPKLALAVVDEQHRFGVLQRAALRGKGAAGAEPHLLLMSATPIPRTLQQTLYGDLDVSVMRELPAGRKEIMTRMVPTLKRENAERFLVDEAQKGRQSFVVCPLIDESEAVLARAATAEYERLGSTTLSSVRVGLLHGRMPLAEKQQVMDQFRAHGLDVLVTTPVIEVGIDVPNATVMLIEGSDRFGLAQLHQLRGRVGRGEHQSYCLLLTESQSEEVRKRLEVLVRTNDGFDIAEADLQLRGPGDFFGTRQSGLPTLKVARLDDRDLLAVARQEARALMAEDPGLSRHHTLGEAVTRYVTAVPDGGVA